MKNKKGFTLVELMSVIVVLAIIIAIAVPVYNKIKINIDKKSYENKIELIEVAASKYAEDTNYEVMFVDDLIKAGYLDADKDNGDILNDLTKDRINCNIVKLKKENGIYYATFLDDKSYEENGTCDINALNKYNETLNIVMYEYENETKGNEIKYDKIKKWWTKTDVILETKINLNEKDIDSIKWYKGYSQEILSTEKIITVTSNSVLQENYKVVVKTKDNKEYSSTVRVYIDKIKPKFYSNMDNQISKEWVTEDKYNINGYDNESGIYGYYIDENITVCPIDNQLYKTPKKQTFENNGTYKVCAMDNVGNVSENVQKITIDKVDPATMKCKIGVSSGIKGNVVNNNQWYIGNSITLKVEPYSNENVGPSGVTLGVSTSNDPKYTNDYSKLEYNEILTSNQNTKTYYGFVKNQAGTSNSCNTKVYYEKSITKPILSSTTNGYDNITATYKDESAISGIKETKCYLTDANGNVIDEGTVDGLKCKFNVTATKDNTTYYFKRCITSNAGNSICSEVNGKSNVGYCTEGNYKTTQSRISGSESACSATCGSGTRTYKYREVYTSLYKSLSCGTSSQLNGNEKCTGTSCGTPFETTNCQINNSTAVSTCTIFPENSVNLANYSKIILKINIDSRTTWYSGHCGISVIGSDGGEYPTTSNGISFAAKASSITSATINITDIYTNVFKSETFGGINKFRDRYGSANAKIQIKCTAGTLGNSGSGYTVSGTLDFQ